MYIYIIYTGIYIYVYTCIERERETDRLQKKKRDGEEKPSGGGCWWGPRTNSQKNAEHILGLCRHFGLASGGWWLSFFKRTGLLVVVC